MGSKKRFTFYHDRSTVTHVRNFYKGLNRLEALGHKDVRFTIHEDLGHDAWVRVYSGNDVYDWMLGHFN